MNQFHRFSKTRLNIFYTIPNRLGSDSTRPEPPFLTRPHPYITIGIDLTHLYVAQRRDVRVLRVKDLLEGVVVHLVVVDGGQRVDRLVAGGVDRVAVGVVLDVQLVVFAGCKEKKSFFFKKNVFPTWEIRNRKKFDVSSLGARNKRHCNFVEKADKLASNNFQR